ncbi:MAG TPA: DUF805 domain-containing protein, partial [Terriglobia bacterium]|nr:DUF805 domain-containing protein [Terriglobia bacterium]
MSSHGLTTFPAEPYHEQTFRGIRGRSAISDVNKEMPMNWYVEAFRKYAQFSGRARRMEFWMFTLINLLVIVGLLVFSDKLRLA